MRIYNWVCALSLGVGFVHEICLPIERNQIRSIDMRSEFGTIDVSIIYKKSSAFNSSYRMLIDALATSRHEAVS